MRRLISTGSPFERSFGYSRAVIDGDLVFVSGTTGYDYATMILPDEVVQAAPQFVQYFLSSGIAVGGTVAILLQLLLPKPRKESYKAKEEVVAA